MGSGVGAAGGGTLGAGLLLASRAAFVGFVGFVCGAVRGSAAPRIGTGGVGSGISTTLGATGAAGASRGAGRERIVGVRGATFVGASDEVRWWSTNPAAARTITAAAAMSAVALDRRPLGPTPGIGAGPAADPGGVAQAATGAASLAAAIGLALLAVASGTDRPGAAIEGEGIGVTAGGGRAILAAGVGVLGVRVLAKLGKLGKLGKSGKLGVRGTWVSMS